MREDGRLQPITQFERRCDLDLSEEIDETTAERVRRLTSERWRFTGGELRQPSSGCKAKENSWIEFFERAQNYYLGISGMAFQDAGNLETERLERCCVHVVTPDKRLIPFCAFYLTGLNGDRLYQIY